MKGTLIGWYIFLFGLLLVVATFGTSYVFWRFDVIPPAWLPQPGIVPIVGLGLMMVGLAVRLIGTNDRRSLVQLRLNPRHPDDQKWDMRGR